MIKVSQWDRKKVKNKKKKQDRKTPKRHLLDLIREFKFSKSDNILTPYWVH